MHQISMKNILETKKVYQMIGFHYAQKQAEKFVKKIATDLMKHLPDKKLTGAYSDSWYRYSSLRVGLEIRRYCTWTNYDTTEHHGDDLYYRVEPSNFRWFPLIDEEEF